MRTHRGIAVLALLALLLTGCTTSKGDAAPSRSPTIVAPVMGTAENSKEGTPDWQLRRKAQPEEIEGYADRVSVLPGESFQMFVSTSSPGFTVEAFRVGWYGGARARKVWESEQQPGRRQAAAKINTKTGTVTAPWQPSLTVTAKDWPEGVYLLRLTADTGAQRYVPITVRSASTEGKVVVLNATTTWQAYNRWGGYNLYAGPTGYSTRSRAVSFDRPYDKDGTGKFMSYEHPAVVLAEKTGVPLAYATDNDLHENPDLLKGSRGLLTLGHDEYWSTPMREHTKQARDSGVNVAFLGANAINRHIRFADTQLGKNRLVICYKDSTEDPEAASNPAESTQDWRLPPQPRPESDLIGIMYNCFPATGTYTIHRPKHWLYRGTGVRKGTGFPGVIGPETDALNWAGPTPRPIEVIAHSPINCGAFVRTADSTYYTTKSGSGVFATGTMRWVCAMRGPRCGHGVTTAGQKFVTKVTENLLHAMAAGPLGQTYPVKDNLKEFSPY